jgi:branched-chain amino acid transport system substrate-binding protein
MRREIRWRQSTEAPVRIGWAPDYRTEASIYAQYVLANIPDAKIAILYQNDDFGKDLIAGMRTGLGDRDFGVRCAGIVFASGECGIAT